MACALLVSELDSSDVGLVDAAHIQIAGSGAAAVARRFVRDRLGDLDEDMTSIAELLASEMVTTGVLRTSDEAVFGVSRLGDHVLVTLAGVDDLGQAKRGSLSRSGSFEQFRYATALIASLADDFGWRTVPGRAGVIVWFMLHTEASASIGAVNGMARRADSLGRATRERDMAFERGNDAAVHLLDAAIVDLRDRLLYMDDG
jgi:hypothetical protein